MTATPRPLYAAGVAATRVHFATSLAADFLSSTDLEATLGASRDRFAQVAAKELVDNALDAAEAADLLPEVAIAAAGDAENHTLTLTVTDNGPGIPPQVVAQVLDFDRRVSDKRRYQTPSRGQQGNALKGIVGIATVLGGRPVVIDAGGIRHEISAELVGDQVIPAHRQTRIPPATGTTVTLTVDAAGQQLDLHALAAGVALANPHVTIKVLVDEAVGRLTGCVYGSLGYRRTVERCRKYQPRPDRFGAPAWYDADSFAGLVLATAELPAPPPLGAFVRSFDGLTATARAKAVLDRWQTISKRSVGSLADLRGRLDLISDLLSAMQHAAAPVPPSKLGPAGKKHLLAALDTRYAVDGTHWYQRAEVDVDGMPWVVEVLVAQVERPGQIHYLVNHSPAFSDPFNRTWMAAGEVSAVGLAGLFGMARVLGEGCAAAVSLICPAPTFTDRGKTTMIVPRSVADAAADVVWSTSKACYRAWKAAVRDANRQARQHRRPPAKQVTLRDAVFAALPAAYRTATGGYLPTSCRNLFYKVRPLIQRVTSKELKYEYLYTLLTGYREEHPNAFPLLFYKARGLLVEPHTATTVPLGTREVDDYTPPLWLYDKILYVEKEGLRETFDYVHLVERYDMAIVYGEGFAPEAARSLVAQLQKGRACTVFVLHDADLDGYLIKETFAEATRRMPNHHIEVVDLGLTVAQTITQGMTVEYRERKKALPERLVLTGAERAWFEGEPLGGRDEPTWRCQRVELNEFTAPELVEFVEQRLADVGADEKVMPPDAVLKEEAEAEHRRQIEELIRDVIAEAAGQDELVAELIGSVPVPSDGLADDVAALYAEDRSARWTRAVENRLARALLADRDKIRARILQLAIANLNDASGGAA